MKCLTCQFENPDGAKFCNKCGNKLAMACLKCGNLNPPASEFCNECGQRLAERLEAEKLAAEPEGERKHVTVVFSDLSGYTAMSEKLDPEEVKEIMSRIFGEIAQVMTKYEGFVEKFVGDAVMALFGVPKAHEDDPVRAIRAAQEIHAVVEAMSPEMEEKVGHSLSMHSGVNTGLVVTGEVNLAKGTHGVAGDTINLASRLSGLAKTGEIVVGPDTYRQAEGYFTFETLEPTKVKGKENPVQIYKVLSPKEEPRKIHRLQGLRADLIGRKVEMAQLGEAVDNVRQGKGSIFSIYGDAGTGKSRLVEEFKATLDLKQIQWREGHAYPYSQNIPYFPLIDLLSRAFRIEEGDRPERVREKVEEGIERLVEKKEDIAPYVGSLYALSYPEIEGVSPEFWKARLQEAIQTILAALTQRGPTVVCLEDLHWADPSSTELLRTILTEFRSPALFLCVYRPPFSLFTSHQVSGMGRLYQEIRLQDLSPSEAQGMVESLLKTENIPLELRRFIQERIEGNPFYLEEVINALIESGTLLRDNGTWRLERPISESDIPSTVQGVISARLDRLERETKRILQEASVIGRAFLYEILKRITELEEETDRCLSGLERLDLIRTRSFQPDLEYIFKHALTQEVAYSGLLKKERKEIHERIAIVMEQLFYERLPEFYETLAFHFRRGRSVGKALDYLVKSGEKSFERYSLDESHQYFEEAFDNLSAKPLETKDEQSFLIDLLIKWASVFYYRGAYGELIDLLKAHTDLAESVNEKERLGMFYAWLGLALWGRGNYRSSYQYLYKALDLGEEVQNHKVIGYSCAWLSRTCADLGLLDDAVVFGERAQEISRAFKLDKEFFRHSFAGLGYAYYFKGESKKTEELGRIVLDYGQKQSDIRMTTMGHMFVGWGRFVAGDLPSAIECFHRSIQVSIDPMFSYLVKLLLGYSYLANDQFQEAEDTLEEVMSFVENVGFDLIGTAARGFQGLVLVIKGNLNKGISMAEEVKTASLETGNKYRYALFNYMLGKVYLQIFQRKGPKSLSFLVKNFGFLVKNVPVASKKAEEYFTTAIEVAKEIGAKGVLGQAYLDLGFLHKTKGKKDKAMECILTAVRLFERCEAEVYLKQAKEALAELG